LEHSYLMSTANSTLTKTIHLYVKREQEAEDWVKLLGLRPLEKGGVDILIVRR